LVMCDDAETANALITRITNVHGEVVYAASQASRKELVGRLLLRTLAGETLCAHSQSGPISRVSLVGEASAREPMLAHDTELSVQFTGLPNACLPAVCAS